MAAVRSSEIAVIASLITKGSFATAIGEIKSLQAVSGLTNTELEKLGLTTAKTTTETTKLGKETQTTGEKVTGLGTKAKETEKETTKLAVTHGTLQSVLKTARTAADDFGKTLEATGVKGKGLDRAVTDMYKAIAKPAVLDVLKTGLVAGGMALDAANVAAKAATQGFMSAGGAMDTAGAQANAFSQLAAKAGPALIAAGIAALIMAGILAAPFIPVTVAATVVLAAFALGVSAAAATITLGLGGFLAFGGVIALLGNRVQAGTQLNQAAVAAQVGLTTATNAHLTAVQQLATFQANTKGHALNATQLQMQTDLQANVTKTTYDLALAQNALAATAGNVTPPLQKFTDHVGTLLDTLGKQAGPMLGPIADLLTGVADRLANVGKMLIDWFGGDRLTAIIDLVKQFAGQFITGLVQLGPVLGKFFDAFIAAGPVLSDLFGQLTSVGIKAIEGILTNMLRLSDWFTARLPTLGPIVAQIFGALGDAVQGVATGLGHLVDWFIEHWPQITALAKGAWQAMVDGWNVVGPILGAALPEAVSAATLAIKYLHDHSEALHAIFAIILIVLGIVIASFGLVVGAIVTVIVIIQAAIDIWKLLAGVVYDALTSVDGSMTNTSDGTKALVAAFQWVDDRIGEIFSAIGTTVANGLNAAIGFIDDFLNKIHSIPVLGGILFPGAVSIPQINTASSVGASNVNTHARAAGNGGGGGLTAAMSSVAGGLGGLDVGSIGGQCVQFVEDMLHVFFSGNANNWVNAPFEHTQTPSAGEIAVFTGGPYGHVAVVTGPGDGFNFPVIDSNWVAPLTVGAHMMNKGMYEFATFLKPGISAGTYKGIPGVTAPVDLLNGLVKDLKFGGGWIGGLEQGVVAEIVKAATTKFDHGGIWPTGTLGVNTSGRDELVLTGNQAAKMGSTEIHLHSVGRLDPAMVREAQRLADWEARTRS